MAKNKRDRPGKRGGLKEKLSNALIVLLAVVAFGACVSLAAFSDFGGDSSSGNSKPNGSTVIIPPESDSGTETPEEPEKTLVETFSEEKTIDDLRTCKDTNGVFEISNEHITYDKSVGVTGKEYVVWDLIDQNTYLQMSSYDKLTIEFELYNTTNNGCLGCQLYVVGRQNDNTGIVLDLTEMILRSSSANSSSDGGYCSPMIETDGDTYSAENIKIRYEITVNRQSLFLSEIAVFVDNSMWISENFMFEDTFSSLSEIRFRNFVSIDYESSLGINNLKVTGYNYQ